MKKFLLCLTVFLVCLLSGCGEGTTSQKNNVKQVSEYENQNETPQRGGTLRLALTGADNLNPILTRSQNNIYLFKLLYDGLFEVAPNQRIEPVLCESYTVSEDGLFYTFRLKSGVSFHNGAPLSAADADRTLELILATEGYYRNTFSMIDSHRSEGMNLYIRLNQPVVNFPALLDFPVLSAADIGSPSQAAHLALSYVPNGTGRYKVQSYKRSKEVYLSVNQNYHRSFTPYIDNVLIYQLTDDQTAVTMLENLQIDVLPSCVMNLYKYTPKRNLSRAEFSGGNFTFIGINNQHPALLTPLTRTALSEALKKEKLMESGGVKYAEAVDLPFPKGSFWSDDKPEDSEEGLEAATSLIEDGWRDTDADGVLDKIIYGEKTDLFLDILVNEENQSRVKIAEAVKSQLIEAGIAATVTAVPFTVYTERVAGRSYDLFVGGTSLSANYDLSFLLKTDANPCGISIERADSSLSVLAMTAEEGQKQALFYDLCDTLKREMPLIPLFFEHEMLVFDNRIKGAITPSASDLFYGIEHWFLSGN